MNDYKKEKIDKLFNEKEREQDEINNFYDSQEVKNIRNQQSGGRTFKNNKRRLRRRKKNGTKKLNKKF